jgi:hypothetical protein
MGAQERIVLARACAGETDEEIDRALEECEPPDAASLTDQQLYETTLKSFVAALGGRLEGDTAVFADQMVTLPTSQA